MGIKRSKLRTCVKSVLGAVGLLPVAQRLRELITPVKQIEREDHNHFLQFKRQHEKILQVNLNGLGPEEQKMVLFCGVGYPMVEAELGLIKVMELEGYIPVVVIHQRETLALKYYNLAVKNVIFWEDFFDSLDFESAEKIIDRYQSIKELVTFEYKDNRAGLFAVATLLRRLRLGSINLHEVRQRQLLIEELASAIRYVRATEVILQTINPQLVIFFENVYSPEGEVADMCSVKGLNSVSWGPAHKSNALLFTRFKPGNKKLGLWSLSDESWQFLLDMPWTEKHRERLKQEIYGTYASGDWFSAAGTQFHKRFLDAAAIKMELGLDTSRKTAFIFPHILWDASFSQGTDLFQDYEDWLVRTIQAASGNDKVNWVIKIHPANVGKAMVRGDREEPAEVIALRRHIKELPPHVFFIPAESPISTFSFFGVMDYCLTVRGTIGIEAARMGIPVLTAGTGRYDRKGFTIDSETREEYLEKIAHIQEFPRISLSQQELAERFAYGIFVLRPLSVKSITFEFHNQKTYHGNFKLNIKTMKDWCNAMDLRAFSRWVVDSSESDFINTHVKGLLRF